MMPALEPAVPDTRNARRSRPTRTIRPSKEVSVTLDSGSRCICGKMCRLFRGIDAIQSCRLLAFISDRTPFRVQDRRTYLCKQGEEGDSAPSSCSKGSAEIQGGDPRWREARCQVSDVNSIVGEIAILCDVPRTATPSSLRRILDVLTVSKDDFLKLCSRSSPTCRSRSCARSRSASGTQTTQRPGDAARRRPARLRDRRTAWRDDGCRAFAQDLGRSGGSTPAPGAEHAALWRARRPPSRSGAGDDACARRLRIGRARNLGADLCTGAPPCAFDLFFTHTHLDHICGLPFFKPAYDRALQD